LEQLDESWMKDALCKDHDTALFYPDTGETNQAKNAIMICKRCPVRAECLYSALSSPETFGVWGGYSYRGRRKLVKNFQGPITMELIKKVVNDGLY